MFALLALPLAAYTVYAFARGEVWVSDGPGARLVTRRDSPAYFRACIFIYAALALALVFIF